MGVYSVAESRRPHFAFLIWGLQCLDFALRLRRANVTLLGFFFSGTAVAANLVVGGGFEAPIVPAGAGYLVDATPTGWSGIGDLTQQGYSGSVPSGDGNQWFDLNPDTSAGTGISQSLTLAAGTTYQFSFLYNGGGGGTTTQIGYSLASNAEMLLSGSVSTALLNVYSGSAWKMFSTSFTPSIGGSETLTFLPNGTYSGGFIDAVNISPIPEPSTIALLAIGAIGLLVKRNIGRRSPFSSERLSLPFLLLAIVILESRVM